MNIDIQLMDYAKFIHEYLERNRIPEMTLAITAFDKMMQTLDDSTTIDHPLIITLDLFKVLNSEKFTVIEEAVQYAFIRIFHAVFDHVLLKNIEDEYQTLYSKTASNFTEGLEQFLGTEPSPRIQFHCESIIEAIKAVRTNAKEFRQYLGNAWEVLTSALSDPIQCIPNVVKLFIDISKNWQGTWFC